MYVRSGAVTPTALGHYWAYHMPVEELQISRNDNTHLLLKRVGSKHQFHGMKSKTRAAPRFATLFLTT